MKYFTPAIAFFSVALLSACTTVEFVRKDLSPTKQAVVRYLPANSEKKEAKYKAEVNKKATSFCEGAYDITKEYQARENTGTSTGVGTGFGIGMGGIMLGSSQENTAMYNFVEFTCKK